MAKLKAMEKLMTKYPVLKTYSKEGLFIRLQRDGYVYAGIEDDKPIFVDHLGRILTPGGEYQSRDSRGFVRISDYNAFGTAIAGWSTGGAGSTVLDVLIDKKGNRVSKEYGSITDAGEFGYIVQEHDDKKHEMKPGTGLIDGLGKKIIPWRKNQVIENYRSILAVFKFRKPVWPDDDLLYWDKFVLNFKFNDLKTFENISESIRDFESFYELKSGNFFTEDAVKSWKKAVLRVAEELKAAVHDLEEGIGLDC